MLASFSGGGEGGREGRDGEPGGGVDSGGGGESGGGSGIRGGGRGAFLYISRPSCSYSLDLGENEHGKT